MSIHKQHKNSGFSVPDGYFEKLTDRVMESVQQDQTHAGFEVPEDYFTSLEDRVMQNLESAPVIALQPEPDRSTFRTLRFVVLAVAAVFIGIICLNTFINQNSVFQINQLADDEVNTYVEEVAFLEEEEDLELLFSDTSILNEMTLMAEISEDELIDYLEDEGSLIQIMSE